jgi:hypothetical protein
MASGRACYIVIKNNTYGTSIKNTLFTFIALSLMIPVINEQCEVSSKRDVPKLTRAFVL